ncbi:MAG: FAD-dependent oxidoreductase, partial [Deltaproteobacteria bacterium]|nr:FAD-dependent oxidoreductase [Deltaproteobacteria bacterium]
YETGATLFSGLHPDGLFGRWRQTHALDVDFVFPEVPITLRTPDLDLPIYRDRARFIASLAALPGAPVDAIHRFFAEQGRVAEALWPILDDANRLMPFGPGALMWHLRRLPLYLPLLRHIGRPALRLLERHDLAQFAPLRTWVDANSQITVQVDAAQAEAPFALSTMDYIFRGTGHVHGGIGALATALVGAIEKAGGQVHMPARVRRIEQTPDGYIVHARNRRIRTRQVVANLLPEALSGLLDEPGARLRRLQASVDAGWSACMLYLQLQPSADLPSGPFHLELINDADSPFVDGNHIFVSVSASDEKRGPDGVRTATVSTHVRPEALREAPAAQVEAVQARMMRTLARLAPEVDQTIVHRLTASPRTWQRFTRRPRGLVGGVPRTVGLHNYRQITPTALKRGLWLVGDSVFPGQSTLATALGGAATARALLRSV